MIILSYLRITKIKSFLLSSHHQKYKNMTISLHIEYHAQWGAQLYVTTGNKPKFGQRLPKDAIDMDNDGRGNWFVDVDASLLSGTPYHYVLAYQRRVVRNEYGNGHYIAGLNDVQGVPTLRVWDDWRKLPQIRSFFSLAFRPRNSMQELQKAHPIVDTLVPNQMTIVCEAGKLQDDWMLALIGNVPELGAWDPAKAMPMEQISRNLWSVSFSRTTLRFPLRFKFVLLNRQTHEFIAWEDCTNRYFEPSVMDDGDSLLICNQRFTRMAQEEKSNS